jgi:hypothetical protein
MTNELKAEVTFTCEKCGSGITVMPKIESTHAHCDICNHDQKVKFSHTLATNGILDECPCCARKDFYRQKDFNRKIGVALFVLASILSFWTYGISLIVLYLFDLFLFRRLGEVAACYKCNTLFRKLTNMAQIPPFDHEMNDRNKVLHL